MAGSYDIWLVTLSVAVAVLASYTALDLAARIAKSTGTGVRRSWLIGGAISMGSESPRVLRRLQSLRRWSHEQIKPFFPGST